MTVLPQTGHTFAADLLGYLELLFVAAQDLLQYLGLRVSLPQHSQFTAFLLVAQRKEQRFPKPKIGGSNPSGEAIESNTVYFDKLLIRT